AAAPDEAVALLVERGWLFENEERHDDAIGAFEQALELETGHPGARHGLKQAYRAAGRHDAYLETLEPELAGDPDPQRVAEVADAWAEHERLDRALACWERLVAAVPSHAGGRKGLARTLERMARWPDLAAAHRAHLGVVSGAEERPPVLLEL